MKACPSSSHPSIVRIVEARYVWAAILATFRATNQGSWRNAAGMWRVFMPRSAFHAKNQFYFPRGAHSPRLRLCRHSLPIVRFRSDHSGETHRSLGFGDMGSDAEYMANPRTG